jgi:hypothetical protein
MSAQDYQIRPWVMELIEASMLGPEFRGRCAELCSQHCREFWVRDYDRTNSPSEQPIRIKDVLERAGIDLDKAFEATDADFVVLDLPDQTVTIRKDGLENEIGLFIDPHAGQRLWIYAAVLPSDERDPDEVRQAKQGIVTAFCTSSAYPSGELGSLVRPEDDPAYHRITKDQYVAASKLGWPPMSGGQG